jgi:hypothetical protein
VTINYPVRGRVIDVYLSGTASDLAWRGDEFASILAGGVDALVKKLRERTETLLAASPFDPEAFST